MGFWNTRGLRGSALEDLVNFTNDYYRQRGLALFQKIPTPITPVEVSNEKRIITLAYFDKQSTVDYIGVVQGIAVCFDAKETTLKSLPIQNIHPHQIAFMKDFQKQNGISFLLVYFSAIDSFYFLPFETLEQYWTDSQKGGRKSIPLSAFEEQYHIKHKNGILQYLDVINTYLINQE
ncbi:MAG: Holliday junction resolvase RecU [Firmicutes bacterium]|jgi:recombination protein U|nr:Holliday junction resolvase RecU [Bacillota bacterium]